MKIVKWDDDKIEFSDGSYITYDHKQDCCEYNYADFSVLDVFYDHREFDDYSIEMVKYGFNLVLSMHGGYFHKRIYIPFYSLQNGYYSVYCDLLVHKKDKLCISDNEGFELSDDIYYFGLWRKDEKARKENEGRFMEMLSEDNLRAVTCDICEKVLIENSNAACERWIEHHVENVHPHLTCEMEKITTKGPSYSILYRIRESSSDIRNKKN